MSSSKSKGMTEVRTVKPIKLRVDECINLLKQLQDKLEIPATNPSIRALKKRMADYWRMDLEEFNRREGHYDAVEGSLPLVSSDRMIHYRFPVWSHKFVEIWLKVHHGPREYPADLQGFIDE
jgi:hypothetical protein